MEALARRIESAQMGPGSKRRRRLENTTNKRFQGGREILVRASHVVVEVEIAETPQLRATSSFL